MCVRLIFYLLTLHFVVCGGFHLLKEKILCKWCPLYCSKHLKHHSRLDDDVTSLSYEDDWSGSPTSYHDYHHDHPIHTSPVYQPVHQETSPWSYHTRDHEITVEYSKKYIYKPVWHTTATDKPTTTTMKPTTTTEEPTGICMFCEKKCNFPPKDEWW